METALILLGIAAAIVVGLLVWGRFWPYAPCPACRGRRGRSRGSRPAAYNYCRRCGGRGERVRPLSRIYPKWNAEAKRRRAQIREARRR